MTTNRWYILGWTPEGYDFVGWSRTQEAAIARCDKADRPGHPAIKVYSPSRKQATLDAFWTWDVKVKGYIDPVAKRLGQAIVRNAVVRQIFCPWSGVVLDMRRAVVITV